VQGLPNRFCQLRNRHTLNGAAAPRAPTVLVDELNPASLKLIAGIEVVAEYWVRFAKISRSHKYRAIYSATPSFLRKYAGFTRADFTVLSAPTDACRTIFPNDGHFWQLSCSFSRSLKGLNPGDEVKGSDGIRIAIKNARQMTGLLYRQ
jgi:hypothetical protein